MPACRACGGFVDARLRACPDCGMPSPAPAAAGGWFSFEGRLSLAQFWWRYALPLAAVDIATELLGLFADIGLAPSLAIAAVTFVGSIAGSTKRLHDRDRSGWFQLWLLVPVIGWIWVTIELTLLPGTQGPNRYGPRPT